MRKIYMLMLSLVIGLNVAACGQGGPQAAPSSTDQATTPAPASTTVAQATSQATVALPTTASLAPTAVVSATTATPLTSSTASSQAGNTLVQKAQQRLAAYLGVDGKTLTLKSMSVQEWPDGSLGCPAPGMLYPQIVTPGFLITFSDGQRTYDIHTNQSEAIMILCDNKQPEPLPADTGSTSGPVTPHQDQSSAQPVPIPSSTSTEGAAAQVNDANRAIVQRAQQALANDLGIGVDAVKVVNVEAVEWNDGSLGCPKPGVMYLQVITPGYRVILNAQGKNYEYHTDAERQVVHC